MVVDVDFQTLYHELYLSYLEARKNKRNTNNQIAFERCLEENLYALAEQIFSQTYVPKPAIAFIVFKPVQREIFAADFSDRIVHHLIYRCIYQKYIDPLLIHDSYSCRKGKGTLYGVKRAQYFIRSCTNNYSQSAYILKLDISGYFMNMSHAVLFDKVVALLNPEDTYLGISHNTLVYLIQQTIFINVAKNCHIKGKRSDWSTLPKDKSLFNKPEGYGLPIGNLTSQIFGNIYLNDLDHFVKNTLKFNYYGRYVDDMIFVHQNKNTLLTAIPLLQKQLNKIHLTLHPKKVYLQQYDKGVLFLGHYIKPYRNYIGNRTKANFYRVIIRINNMLLQTYKIKWSVMKKIRGILNSFLGTLSHANTYFLIKKTVKKLDPKFYLFFGFTKNYSKAYIKKEYWQWHYTLTYPSINRDTIC